jgi:non-ribosomal peptide synthetase component F
MIVSGRDLDVPGIEDLVGHFIYSLPLRVHLSEDEDVGTWLQALQTARTEAREHQHVALSELRPADPQAPLFRSLVVFENYPLDLALFRRRDLEVSMRLGAGNSTHHALVLSVQPEGDRMNVFLTYEAARFDRADIVEVAARFVDLLRALSTAAAASPSATARLGSLLSLPGLRALASASSQRAGHLPGGLVPPALSQPEHQPE